MTVSISSEIQGHIDHIVVLAGQRREAIGDLADARVGLGETSAHANIRFTELSKQEADHLLHGAPLNKNLSAAIQEEQGIVIRLQARERGLEARVEQLDGDVRSTRQELQRAVEAWSQAECARARARVRAKSEQYVKDIAGDLAIGRILNDSTLDAMMRPMQLTSLGSGHDLAQAVGHIGWRQNPAMVEILGQYQTVLTTIKQALEEKI